jgi:hypothetical protein
MRLLHRTPARYAPRLDTRPLPQPGYARGPSDPAIAGSTSLPFGSGDSRLNATAFWAASRRCWRGPSYASNKSTHRAGGFSPSACRAQASPFNASRTISEAARFGTPAGLSFSLPRAHSWNMARAHASPLAASVAESMGNGFRARSAHSFSPSRVACWNAARAFFHDSRAVSPRPSRSSIDPVRASNIPRS